MVTHLIPTLAVLALAACGPTDLQRGQTEGARRFAAMEALAARERAMTPEQRAEHYRQMMERADERTQLMQADAICRARGDMARGAYPTRSWTGLDAMVAGEDVYRACIRGFVAAGGRVMPSL